MSCLVSISRDIGVNGSIVGFHCNCCEVVIGCTCRSLFQIKLLVSNHRALITRAASLGVLFDRGRWELSR